MEEGTKAGIVRQVVEREPACITEEYVEFGRQTERELWFMCEFCITYEVPGSRDGVVRDLWLLCS